MLAALTLATAAMAATVAQAKVIQITIDGTVKRGAGNDPVFGVSNLDLADLDFVAVFRFDTSLGNHLQSPTFESAFGGAPHGVPSPSLGGKLTINGVTVFVPGAFSGTVSTANGGAFGSTIQNISDRSSDEGRTHRTLYSEIRTTKPSSIGVSFDTPFTYQVDPQDRVVTYFEFQTYVPDNERNPYRNAFGELSPRTVRLETVVPEPATWAILICGFGLAGAALRRRRRLAYD